MASNDPVRERYTLTLPPELVARVDQAARLERRSRSNLVEVLLETALGAKQFSAQFSSAVGDLAGPAKPAPK